MVAACTVTSVPKASSETSAASTRVSEVQEDPSMVATCRRGVALPRLIQQAKPPIGLLSAALLLRRPRFARRRVLGRGAAKHGMAVAHRILVGPDLTIAPLVTDLHHFAV